MPAPNTLLCPIDFSECALNALEYATRLASYYQAELHILHVLETKEQELEAISEQQRAFAEGKLQRFKETILAETGPQGLKGCTTQVSSGKISAQIMNYADQIQASMLVLGAEGLNEFKPNFIGGNAAKVVMRAAQDVVLVPKKGYFKPPRKVVYATNYLEEDKIAIQKVTHFASFFDAEVDIVHVSSKSKAIDRALHQTMVQELKPFVRYPKSSFVLKTYRDEPGLGLENYLKVAKGDILVTLTKKKSWFDQLFAQNLSKKMSYFINKPLWAVKML